MDKKLNKNLGNTSGNQGTENVRTDKNFDVGKKGQKDIKR